MDGSRFGAKKVEAAAAAEAAEAAGAAGRDEKKKGKTKTEKNSGGGGDATTTDLHHHGEKGNTAAAVTVAVVPGALREAVCGAFVCGLAMTNQHTFVLFGTPLALWVLASGRDVGLWRPLSLAAMFLAPLFGGVTSTCHSFIRSLARST